MPYVAERAGTYYLRLHVPKTIQPLIGQREIFQNLQTTDRTQAKVLALALSSQLLLNFAKVKSLMKNSKTPEQHAQLMRWISAAAVPEAEKAQEPQAKAPEEWSQFQLDTLPNGQPYIKQADPGPDLVAAERALKMAQEAAKLPAVGQPLLQHPASVRKEVHEAFLDLKGVKPKNIHAAAKEYEANLINNGVRSYDHYMVSVNHFVKWITDQHPNIQVHKVGKDHLKAYREVLQSLRSHKKPYALMKPSNIYKRMGFVENFFRYCQQEEWIEDREKALPTLGLKGKKPDYEDGEDSYERFSEADLRAIFSPKNYEHIRDLPHRYWPPLIGLFTGLRRTELSDLKLEHISNFNAEKVWTMTVYGRLKNKNSKRQIPLPQALIDLGFLEYIEDLKRYFPEAKTLFPYSNNASKAVGDGFATYLDRLKITDSKKVFHSFRKNVSKVLLDAGVVDYKYQEHYTGHLKYSLHEKVYSGKEKPIAFYANLINTHLKYDLDLSFFKYKQGMFDEKLSSEKKALEREARRQQRQKSLKG
jgi:integrase